MNVTATITMLRLKLQLSLLIVSGTGINVANVKIFSFDHTCIWSLLTAQLQSQFIYISNLRNIWPCTLLHTNTYNPNYDISNKLVLTCSCSCVVYQQLPAERCGLHIWFVQVTESKWHHILSHLNGYPSRIYKSQTVLICNIA